MASLHYVVLIHGIRTRAGWQEMVRQVLESNPNIRVRPIKYGRFDLLRFLLPGPTRRGPIERTKKNLALIASEARRNGADLSVIAHSYGTYTISKILEEDRSVELKHLILCGSIVDSNYDWPAARAQFTGKIVNDYGVRNIWPVIARWATSGYDATGTYGFYGSVVDDRLHDKDHSSFFSSEFVEQFWKPLISSDQVVRQAYDSDRIPASPSYYELFGFRLIWILLILVGSLAIWFAYDSLYRPSATAGSTDALQAMPNAADATINMSRQGVDVARQSEGQTQPDTPRPLGMPSDMDGIGWLTIAQKEVGVREDPGPGSTPRIIEYFKAAPFGDNASDDIPWVGAFAAWVLKEAGCDLPEHPGVSHAWLQWGISQTTPKAGSITIFRRRSAVGGIVGFYVSEDSSGINIITGNFDNSVKAVHVSRELVLGYRWPARCQVTPVSH